MGYLYFPLESTALNVPELDRTPCHKCYKKIPVLYKEVKKRGEIIRVRDRSNRMDCDEGEDNQTKLVTYHMKCWRALIHA